MRYYGINLLEISKSRHEKVWMITNLIKMNRKFCSTVAIFRQVEKETSLYYYLHSVTFYINTGSISHLTWYIYVYVHAIVLWQDEERYWWKRKSEKGNLSLDINEHIIEKSSRLSGKQRNLALAIRHVLIYTFCNVLYHRMRERLSYPSA